MNGYKFIQSNNLLSKLKIESIEMILKSKELLIKNESWLLERLIEWYEIQLDRIINDGIIIISIIIWLDDNKSELKTEFVNLLLKYIKFEDVIWENLKCSIPDYIEKKIKYEIIEENKNSTHYSIELDEINNERIKDIIFKYFVENERYSFEENDLNMIKMKNLKEIIKILLNKDDIKMKMIGLMLCVDSRIDKRCIYEVIEKEKYCILKELLNEDESKRLIKCLCLFVDNIKYITTIEVLCGKRMLFGILNFHNYLSYIEKEILIKYIQEIELEKEEELEISCLITDEDILKDLKSIYIHIYMIILFII